MTMDVFYFKKISHGVFFFFFFFFFGLGAFSIASLFLATQGEQVGR